MTSYSDTNSPNFWRNLLIASSDQNRYVRNAGKFLPDRFNILADVLSTYHPKNLKCHKLDIDLELIIVYRRFGTTCRSHLHGSIIYRYHLQGRSSPRPLKMWWISRYETSVTVYQHTSRKIPEERRHNLHRGASLISYVVCVSGRLVGWNIR